jgi:hypothetical protein
MEGSADWHGKAPNAEQTATALAELRAAIEASAGSQPAAAGAADRAASLPTEGGAR